MYDARLLYTFVAHFCGFVVLTFDLFRQPGIVVARSFEAHTFLTPTLQNYLLNFFYIVYNIFTLYTPFLQGAQSGVHVSSPSFVFRTTL